MVMGNGGERRFLCAFLRQNKSTFWAWEAVRGKRPNIGLRIFSRKKEQKNGRKMGAKKMIHGEGLNGDGQGGALPPGGRTTQGGAERLPPGFHHHSSQACAPGGSAPPTFLYIA